MIRLLICLFMFCAVNAAAQTLDFPSNASLQKEVVSDLDSYAIPIGIWDNGTIPTRLVEGRLTQQAWRVQAQALTTLQLLQPLREQLRNARFVIIFECQTEACGGFDFRFGTQTLPAPYMQINLGDFRFLAARRQGSAGPEYISLFVSRTAQAGFMQITRVSPEDAPEPTVTTTAPAVRPLSAVPMDFTSKFDVDGFVVLDDLTFETGSSQLGAGPFASLRLLADYLAVFPERTVALVGHTDSAGSLEANIALSKRRAGSVLERLVSDYGVGRRQLEAEGMGYLSPVASNLTEDGRRTNRRVEAIITSTAN